MLDAKQLDVFKFHKEILILIDPLIWAGVIWLSGTIFCIHYILLIQILQ
jgi:hypothetical protein